jgi:CHAD domain-containing protein
VPDGPIRLEAPPHFTPPRLVDLGEGVEVSAPVRSQLTSVYWDTADMRLARWGCSLLAVQDGGWEIEFPSLHPTKSRTSDTSAVAGAADHPPEAALDLLRAYVRTAALRPVAKLRRVRQSVVVGGQGNGSTIRVLSDEISILDGRHVAARYRELVLDAGREADTAVVHGVIARLRAAGAGGPDLVPEYARVLGPASTEAPEVVVVEPGPGSTVAQAVGAAIAASVVRLLRHDAAVRQGVEPEGVHQARVATRRLRSDLGTFGSLLEAEPTDALRDELQWLATLLGEVRDSDVLIERLSSRMEEIPGPASGRRALLQRLGARREAARTRLLAGIRSQRYAVLLDGLVAIAVTPPLSTDGDRPATEVLPRLVTRPWGRLVKAVERLGDDSADEDLHAVRIAAKRARYAAEAVAPVVGKPAHRFAEGVAALQQSLGDYNDTVVARQWLGEVASRLGAGGAFYAGVLTERERLLGEDALRRWRSAWKQVNRKKLHGWMTGD